MKASLTSVWSDGSIVTTPCTYNPKTGRLTNITVSNGPVPSGSLEREFITMSHYLNIKTSIRDLGELEVCQVCHEYTLKKVMNEGVGKQLSEESECPNPNCSDEE